MQCGVIGIHARNSSLSLREVLTKACHKVFRLQEEISIHFSIVPLLTCNRVELYFSCEDLADAHSVILSTLREEIPFAFENNLYSFFGIDCFAHLVRVTSGIDSVIVGETDIQGQVKKAYAFAKDAYALTYDIHFLFQKSLKLAKEIRNREDFPSMHRGLESIIVNLIKKESIVAKDPKILIVGNSDINKKIVYSLKQQGFFPNAMLTRSRLHYFEEKMNVFYWDRMHEWVNYDIVISATNASDYILKYEHLTKTAENKKFLLFDLSVPRTIDPQLEQNPHILLINMETISSILENEKLLLEDKIETMRDCIFMQVERQQLFFSKRHQREVSCIA